MSVPSITIDFVALPAGRFRMGGVPEDKFVSAVELPRHEVEVAAFRLARHPVTRGQWFGGDVEDSGLPVTGVSFIEAEAFALRHGCRLPSEAEWEYACRAGSATVFSHAAALNVADANFLYDESGVAVGPGRVMPVGSHPPNAFGLHDLLGNVCEWTADLWHPGYIGAPDDGTPWIAEVTTCTPPGEYLPVPHFGVETHLASLEEGIVRSLPGGPLFITTMAGSDAWNLDDCLRFHEGVLNLQERHRLVVSVETHRGRPTYNPWRTAELLVAFPELRLTCDFSHWCVVTERLILDQEPDLLEKTARHTHHIHGRVGYAQGPQVPDPRAPEYSVELAAHERWWDVLLAAMRERGTETATFTPESGPDGYLQCQPFTRAPVADLWEINRWIGHRQLDRHSPP